MALTFHLHDEAEKDLLEGIEYYEGKSEGLGEKFYQKYIDTLNLIVSFPNVFPIVHRHFRKAKIKGFLYCIMYRFYKNALIVVAVFHDKRNPADWKGRV